VMLSTLVLYHQNLLKKDILSSTGNVYEKYPEELREAS